jgi:hypothetical protein
VGIWMLLGRGHLRDRRAADIDMLSDWGRICIQKFEKGRFQILSEVAFH